MTLSTRQQGAVLVVTLGGRVAGDDNAAIRTAFGSALSNGHRAIVVDLGELEYLDSAALGEIVACQVRAIKAGAPLRLARAGQRLQDLLVLTRLTTVFDTYITVDEAIESFEE